MTISVTVAVPAFNLELYIGDCLRSLMDQTFQDWKCLVVDDGSTDRTAEVVAGFRDDRITLLTQANAGVSSARNRALAAADTPYLMFLDGDDILHPWALARLVNRLTVDSKAVAAFGAVRKIMTDGSPYPGQKPLMLSRYPDGDVLETMLRENFLANGGQVLLRTAIAQRIGGFDQRLKLSEDWEFWCRLASEGAFKYIGAPPEVFSLRMRPGSASGGLAADWSQHQAALSAVLSNPQLASRFPTNHWKRLAREIVASHRWECGRVNFAIGDFGTAHRLLSSALVEHPTAKRLALYGIAIVSQITGRSIASRFRFRKDDFPTVPSGSSSVARRPLS